MKFQDILFLVVLFIVILKKDSRLSALAGITCLVLSIPLFALWVFFTAEHLVWFSGAFFLLSIILMFKNK